MKLQEFKRALIEHPAAVVRFHLPNGDLVPVHAHVTEAARIDKRFVDCGGTFRQESLCRFQTWVAADLDHRLTAGKLAKIIEKAAPLFGADDLEVDVEHEIGFISQFPVESITKVGDELVVELSERHTACLALDQCCPPTPEAKFPSLKFEFAK